MAEKKSILEEALMDFKHIQNALNANTKEILRSVAREEIDSVVRESFIKEEDFDEVDVDDDDLEDDGSDELGGGLNNLGDKLGAKGDKLNSLGDKLGDLDSDDSDMGGDEMDMDDSDDVDLDMGPEDDMDSMELGGDDMDMTGASDDDVLAIYKKLSGEDEIEIVGDDIHIHVSEPGDYVVKNAMKGQSDLGGDLDNDEDDLDVDDMDGDVDDLGDDLGDEDEFEVEMDDEPEGDEFESDEEGDEFESDEEGDEFESDEEEPIQETNAIGRTTSMRGNNTTKFNKTTQKESYSNSDKRVITETVRKYNSLLTEATKLKSENEQFRKALTMFRSQLVETVVFNSNLTYTARLFMEHSTTKSEKENIIKRFDNEVSNLVESKKLYKTIVNELQSRKPILESIESKIIKGVTTGTSKQLTENTAYVDPSTKRIMDLINRVENR